MGCRRCCTINWIKYFMGYILHSHRPSARHTPHARQRPAPTAQWSAHEEKQQDHPPQDDRTTTYHAFHKDQLLYCTDGPMERRDLCADYEPAEGSRTISARGLRSHTVQTRRSAFASRPARSPGASRCRCHGATAPQRHGRCETERQAWGDRTAARARPQRPK